MHITDLQAACTQILGDKASKIILAFNELTIECLPENYLYIMQTLRDHEDLHFESLVICAVWITALIRMRSGKVNALLR